VTAALDAPARRPAPDEPGQEGEDRGFALYVHWPFCLAKCPYCDFNSHVREAVDHAAWRRALLAELDHFAAETKGRRLSSIFFGGGTPSLMDPGTVGALLDRAAAHWRPADACEVTLEANPTSVEAGRLAAFRDAGVNRVSLGVQALDDDALAFLGRRHGAAEALAAVDLARRLFARVSFDLIYARPGQTPAAWAGELRAALERAADHLSVYQLTVEPGTRFAALAARGDLRTPDEDAAAALYEVTQSVLADAGLPAYEISNHARPGSESRHNLVYWRAGDYVGIGPGAHGRLSRGGARIATRTHRAPEVWLDRVARHGHGEHPRETVSPTQRVAEALMMGLRLAEGVPLARLEAVGGAPADAPVDPDRRAALVAAGFLTDEPDRLRATPAGRQRLDAVIAHLLG